MMTEEKTFNNLRYFVKYPKNYDYNKTYPVLLFMHGAGTRGTDMGKIHNNPFYSITNGYEDFPFITVAPLCHANTWFDIFESVIGLTNYIYNCKFTDKKRFYAMGVSMGGYALWQLAMSRPEIFAAIVPICGGGMYWNAERLKNIPVWAFHGDNDKTVFVEESKKMVEAIVRNGGQAKLTIYKDCGHDAWSETYRNPKVFEWLLSHTNKETDIVEDSFNNSEIYG